MYFTTGFWKIDEALNLPLAVIRNDEDGEEIAQICEDNLNKANEECISNAILIVSAPELLNVCRTALRQFQLLGSGQISEYSNSEMCILLGDVIDKAIKHE